MLQKMVSIIFCLLKSILNKGKKPNNLIHSPAWKGMLLNPNINVTSTQYQSPNKHLTLYPSESKLLSQLYIKTPPKHCPGAFCSFGNTNYFSSHHKTKKKYNYHFPEYNYLLLQKNIIICH